MKNIKVCCGVNCSKRGSQAVFEEVKKEFRGGDVQVKTCSCLGMCEQGVNVVVDEEKVFHHSGPGTIVEKIKTGKGEIYKKLSEEEILESCNFLGDI